MVLESTMICVDDSDYMRNGDFVPTRMAAIQDAVSLISYAKTRANPENNIGLLTLASSEVLATLTTDANKLMSKMLAVQPGGELKLMSGLRVAHLALKHRQGKNHKMRIVAFVGSPVELNQADLIRLAKRLKKEKVNVDVVSFGEDNSSVLQTFVDTLNGKDGVGSHLVIVPPGPTLTDAVKNSPIMQTEDGNPMAAGGYDDFDPNDDPELALALRVSMEEQRARQEQGVGSATEGQQNEGATNEEQMLERALAMSRDGGAQSAAAAPPPSVNFSMMSEDEQIAYALQMSLASEGASSSAETQPVPPVGEIKIETEPMDVEPSEGDDNKMEISSPTTEKAVQDLASVLEAIPGDNVKTEPSSSTSTSDAPAQSSTEKKTPEKKKPSSGSGPETRAKKKK